MKLSRPAALALLVLCALVVFWLVARTMSGGGEETASTPTGGSVAPTVTFGGPLPEPTDVPTTEPASAPATSSAPPKPSPPPSPSPKPTPPPVAQSEGPTGVDTRDWDGIDACDDRDLPAELDEVVDDIEAGGPFEYPGKDGSTFGNYEGYLPDESRGYYREYTVETPGLSHRGAKRVVTGGDDWDPEVWYYTDDHYESFCEFAP